MAQHNIRIVLCEISVWVRLVFIVSELRFDSFAVEGNFQTTYNHFIFVSINCLSVATTHTLDSCKEFFSVLLFTVSIICFLAWHRSDHQHSRNNSASPRKNSANKGDEQDVYVIHQE